MCVCVCVCLYVYVCISTLLYLVISRYPFLRDNKFILTALDLYIYIYIYILIRTDYSNHFYERFICTKIKSTYN